MSGFDCLMTDISEEDKPLKDIDDKWKLIPAFLEVRGLMKQHIDSYNYFINVGIKNIIKSNNYVRSEQDPNFYLKYLDIRVGKPHHKEGEDLVDTQIFPHNCRIRDITYGATIFVDVEYTKGGSMLIANNIPIGQMPIMLGSSNCWLTGKSNQELARMKECPYDPRGYFIIKGVEKVILIQEQQSKNRIMIEYDAKKNLMAHVTYATADTKSMTIISHKNGKFAMKQNFFEGEIPIIIIFKAMGMQSDQEIIQIIGSEQKYIDGIFFSLQEAAQSKIITQKQALLYIANKLKTFKKSPEEKMKEALNKLFNIIIAHIPGSPKNYVGKCRYIGLMIRRIIDAQHDSSKIDDKDYYGNKRLELAGYYLSLLFEDLFKKINSDLKREADKLIPKHNKDNNFDLVKRIRTDTLTFGMETAIKSGNWVLKRFKMDRKITEPLDRTSYASTLGMMCRIHSQFEKTRKISGPRSLQTSQWGIIDPCDTPEGESCGLVKTLALTSHVTTDQDEGPIRNLAINLGMEDADMLTGEGIYSPGIYLIFLNGQPIGVHNNPRKFMNNFRLLRRKGKIHEFVSIYEHEAQQAIYIATDGGRLIRPLLIVEDSRPKLKRQHLQELSLGIRRFRDFLSDGIVEYLDVNEENSALIAVNEHDLRTEITHMEIDPLSILGCIAGIIPFPHHNQSPRNSYQCAMGKQAIGAIGLNQFNRIDTVVYLLVYPQAPLVKTKTIEIINYDKIPGGQNASVAIMSFSGYDIEDAIIMNKGSLDRGFGRSMVFRRNIVPLKRYPNQTKDIIVPPPKINTHTRKGRELPKHLKKYRALDDDGMAKVGFSLEQGDIFLNKEIPEKTQLQNDLGALQEAIPYKADPSCYKETVPAYVDRIIITKNSECSKLYKIITRQTRRPEIGDKYSSRHGQKGVIGLISPSEDMPFNEQGWSPDLIMNPHGFPSRMTVGKMIELLAGKAGVLYGEFKYGTAFHGENVKDLGRLLVSKGFSYDGKDLLISGINGLPLTCFVFSGPIYYQRLKHMVIDKTYARATGLKTVLTRQPTQGRARGGGLKVGEMERDSLVGYGAVNLLNERLFLSSDLYIASVCSLCGFIGYDKYCTYCDSTDNIVKIKLPYACKLLLQELQSMNIKPQLKLRDI